MRRRVDRQPEEPDATDSLPYGIRIGAAWSWRFLVIVAAAAVVVWLVIVLNIVVVPLAVAVLLSGLLTPFKNWMLRRGFPRWLAVVITFLSLLIALAALVTLVTITLRSGFGDFQQRTVLAYESLRKALADSTFGISNGDVRSWIATVQSEIQKNAGTIVSGALTGASTVGHVIVGAVLALFITLFFLLDGANIWRWCVRLAPQRARAAIDDAGRAAWVTVGQYVRVQVVVALIDAIGIGLTAVILGVPFAIPIAVLVFLAAFIPFVGAIVTGALAVFVALVYNGPVNALLMLGGVILVNQVESHVLQPILMGGAVSIHPVGVVLAVSVGSLVGGIAGAVFAVPITAAANSIVRSIAGGAWKGAPPPPPPTRKPPRTRRPRPKDVTTVG